MAKSIINPDTELSPLQEQAIFLLASGKSVTNVATEINVDRATLYNWLKLPEFEAYYNKVRWEIKTQTKNELLTLYSQAISAVKECLKSENENVRLKASFYVLDKVNDLDFGTTSKTVIERNIIMDW